MEAMPIHFMARLDPAEIPRPLLPEYFERLVQHKLYDRAIEPFEQIGYADELHDTWRNLIGMSVLRQERTAAERARFLEARQTLILLQRKNKHRERVSAQQRSTAETAAPEDNRVEKNSGGKSIS